MGKRAKLEIKESLSNLKIFYNKQDRLHLQKRVRALILIKADKGVTRQEIADQIGIDKRTLERWVTRYKKGGLKNLVNDSARRQGSKIITAEIHSGISKRVHDPHNSFLGYWDARDWIKREYNKDVNYHRVREYMIQHFGTKVKTPRKSHIKKDEQAVAFFKNAK